MARLRVGVLISGRGSNLQALIAACSAEAYPAEIALVISSRAEAPGLGFAAAAAFPPQSSRIVTGAISRRRRSRGFASTGSSALPCRLHANIGREFRGRRDRMVNIHPSLLPSFRGLHAQRQALAAGVRFAGCTVHFVRPELDCGPIIGQAVVPVHPGDDEARLSQRILEAEHRLYPMAVRLIAEGSDVTGLAQRRAEILNGRIPDMVALNPQDSPGDPLASNRG